MLLLTMDKAYFKNYYEENKTTMLVNQKRRKMYNRTKKNITKLGEEDERLELLLLLEKLYSTSKVKNTNLIDEGMVDKTYEYYQPLILFMMTCFSPKTFSKMWHG